MEWAPALAAQACASRMPRSFRVRRYRARPRRAARGQFRTAFDDADVVQRRDDTDVKHAVVRVCGAVVLERDRRFDFAARHDVRAAGAGKGISARRKGRLRTYVRDGLERPRAATRCGLPFEQCGCGQRRSVGKRRKHDGVDAQAYLGAGRDRPQREPQRFLAAFAQRFAVDRRPAANEEQLIAQLDSYGDSRSRGGTGVERRERKPNAFARTHACARLGRKRGAIVTEIGGRRNGERGRLEREGRRLLRGDLRARHDRGIAGQRRVDEQAVCQRCGRARGKRANDDWRVRAIERTAQLALEFAPVQPSRVRNVRRMLGYRCDHYHVARAGFAGVVNANSDIRLRARQRIAHRLDLDARQRVAQLRTAARHQSHDVGADRRQLEGGNRRLQFDRRAVFDGACNAVGDLDVSLFARKDVTDVRAGARK